MIGQVLSGNYRLTDLVGSGGYADVYLGRDLRTNTLVAVKVLHQHIARDADLAARFEREASLARRLQTPHVARVLDAGQDDTSPPYMVMEYVQGLTLAELLRRHGPFPILEAVQIIDQLLNALGTAHALGIIHRDIKPQNLMIDGSRHLKVLDFGVARVVGAGTMTASGHLLGTPEYMALEQVEGQPVDHRADLYAAGAVFYQLLTGRPPYVRLAETDLWELIRRVQAELPPSVRLLRPDVPPPLAQFVERAMARSAAQRFQTAHEMREALAAAAGTDPPTPRPMAAQAPVPPLPDDSRPTQQVAGTPVAGRQPAGQPPLSPSHGSPPLPPGTTRIMPAVPGPHPSGPRAGPGQRPPGPPPGYPSYQAPPPYQGAQGGTGRTRGLSGWMIAGLVAGAVAFIVMGALIGRLVPLPGSGGDPTPTVAAATATRAPTTVPVVASPSPASAGTGAPAASPSPASRPSPSPSPQVAAEPGVAPQPSPSAAPRPTNAPGVQLADNFDRPDIAQLPRTSPRPNDYTFTYDAGEYVIKKLNAALPAAPIVFVPGTFNHTVVGVDVRIMGDVASRYAFVVCRDQSSAGQTKQYRASLVPDGRRVVLSRWDSGTQRVLSEARDETAIRTGNEVNRLELRCDGLRIEASVNGKVVASADDMTFNRGEHGIGAGTFSGVEGTLEARFDNLEVRAP